MRAIPQETLDKIVVEWRTGQYSVRDLARRFDVSIGTVAKVTKGVAQDVAHLVNAGVQFKQGLAEQSEQVVNAVQNAVDQRTKDLAFFRTASMIVAKKAATKVQAENCTMQDVRHAAEAISKSKETIFGRQPETAIQINNQQNGGLPGKIVRTIVDPRDRHSDAEDIPATSGTGKV